MYFATGILSEFHYNHFPAGRGIYLCWELEFPAQIETSASREYNHELSNKKINTLFTVRSVRTKKVFPRPQKRPSAFGLRPLLRPRENIFSVLTSQPVNNIYIFLVYRFSDCISSLSNLCMPRRKS
jgi:hypothetical protein